MIVGIDEVGRGALAGPVCVAAVSISENLIALDDSKLLSPNVRLYLAQQIKQQAKLIGIGWTSPGFIDQFGLTLALRQAALKALEPFGDLPELILLDGSHNYLNDDRVVNIVSGDGLVQCISAASIVAKVARDNYMKVMAQRFVGYGFERHVGYGTAEHLTALELLGASSIHRLSFAPLSA